MTADQFTAVDGFIAEKLLGGDADLADVLAANAAAGLRAIDVSPPQGKLLQLLATLSGARRVLEIGTLGGYSTICLARGMPSGGRVVTLELEPKHAAVARANFERAGVANRIELRLGAALDTLPTLAGPFDLIFIDADKPNNPAYLEWAIRLARPGTLIIVDNVIRNGRLVDANSADANVLGSRKLFDLLGQHPKLDATALQMVGSKGWDGFAMALVRG